MEEKDKPKAPIIGADGNVFNLMGICSRELKHAGFRKEADEMINRITTSAKSYDEALAIMMDYVDPVDVNYDLNEEFDDFKVGI